MNVLIYTHEFPPFQGGIATSAKMIADILSSENKLMVCCPDYGIDNFDETENFFIDRINFIGGKNFKRVPLAQYIYGLLKVRQTIRTFKPDKILFLGEEAELIGGLLNNREIDQIVRIAGSGIESIIKKKGILKILSKFLLKRLYRNSKNIIAVSRTL